MEKPKIGDVLVRCENGYAHVMVVTETQSWGSYGPNMFIGGADKRLISLDTNDVIWDESLAECRYQVIGHIDLLKPQPTSQEAPQATPAPAPVPVSPTATLVEAQTANTEEPF